ncbi:MAG: hypothetical protein IPM12_12830 [Flavobacteriales bacterium]|nr:hypothetical protein [Flavobacteriales bacterium]
MRGISILFICMASSLSAQHLSYEEWLHRAMADMRMAPRYGDREKSAAQRSTDAEFVRSVLAVDPVPRSASDRLIQHGSSLLAGGDMVQSMMRFNQAWLVDSTNADSYWGFGNYFLALDRPAVALQWFKRGAELDPTHVRSLLGLAVAALAEQYATRAGNPAHADELVSAALTVLLRAEELAPNDPAIVYRLAVCHMIRGECEQARKQHQRCLGLPGYTVDPGFEEQLRAKCP